ncbi:uncharacterized protein A4U43_C05F28650 [Asparagus officinalis]|uniref:Uncharacterized protein n=1 Tax=Asparagus officinalis TaxID=4686 RepID=A0A5P1F0J8_ASPOF|nr:uncharacterized protein A4U43_C05F28650 [Asparagus officinalis]
MLQVAERQDQVLLNNNTRPARTKKIPEANYGKMNSGKNPKAKGMGRADPSQRGNNAPRGRGHWGRGRGCGRGYGGSSHVWYRDGGGGPGGYDTKAQKTPKNPPTIGVKILEVPSKGHNTVDRGTATTHGGGVVEAMALKRKRGRPLGSIDTRPRKKEGGCGTT